MLTGQRAEAEDLLQSTLLSSIRHQKRILAMAAPAAYLRQVMLHEHLRRRRRKAPPMTVESASTVDIDAVDGRDETWRLLATLRPRQRAVLVLRFYEDLPDAEIAQILGCPESTVRSHARRGLTALRTQLTPDDEGVDT